MRNLLILVLISICLVGCVSASYVNPETGEQLSYKRLGRQELAELNFQFGEQRSLALGSSKGESQMALAFSEMTKSLTDAMAILRKTYVGQ